MSDNYGPCTYEYPGLGRRPIPCYAKATGPDGRCTLHREPATQIEAGGDVGEGDGMSDFTVNHP